MSNDQCSNVSIVPPFDDILPCKWSINDSVETNSAFGLTKGRVLAAFTYNGNEYCVVSVENTDLGDAPLVIVLGEDLRRPRGEVV